jgi:hypothetical protein
VEEENCRLKIADFRLELPATRHVFAVLRLATKMEINSLFSLINGSRSFFPTISVSTIISSQYRVSSVSSRTMPSFEMKSAVDRAPACSTIIGSDGGSRTKHLSANQVTLFGSRQAAAKADDALGEILGMRFQLVGVH